MPATGFFEIAACTTAAFSDSAVGLLTDLTILSPKVLAFGDQAAAGSMLSCSINLNGSLEIASEGMPLHQGSNDQLKVSTRLLMC